MHAREILPRAVVPGTREVGGLSVAASAEWHWGDEGGGLHTHARTHTRTHTHTHTHTLAPPPPRPHPHRTALHAWYAPPTPAPSPRPPASGIFAGSHDQAVCHAAAATLPDGSSLALLMRARVLQGRPKGEDKAADKAKFSLAPVVGRLSECLGQEVKLVDDCIGEPVEKAVAGMSNGQV
eukprot:351841-Chlamydomonas_euryale.AAC.16